MKSEALRSTIWIINADQWPRAMLRAELIERGFDAVGYMTVRDAIDSLITRKPDAIIVDAKGQPAEQVARLTKIGVPVFVVAGHGDEFVDAPYTEVIKRPVTLGELADRVVSNPGRESEK